MLPYSRLHTHEPHMIFGQIQNQEFVNKRQTKANEKFQTYIYQKMGHNQQNGIQHKSSYVPLSAFINLETDS